MTSTSTNRRVPGVPGRSVSLPGTPARPLPVFFAALCLLGSLAAGCHSGSPPAPQVAPTTSPTPTSSTSTTATALPLPPPPYQVVSTTLAFVDPSRPTVSRGVEVSSTRALTTVVWAPAIGGRWPLVVFAPGYRVGPATYDHLCRAWAAAGYVVAAPEFPLADPAVAGSALDEGDLNNEPADVNFVIASMASASNPLVGQVDPTRIAVTGHSDGAEAALAVGQEGDPIIKAVIAMSGQPVVPQRAPNPALLVIQGDRDTINPPGRSLAVYEQAARPRYLLTLLGGSHLGPFSGSSPWQSVIDAVTIDFLNQYLSGTKADDSQMQADAARPGVATLR
jgi:dienelactone hydrolase